MGIFDVISLISICLHYVLSFEFSISPILHSLICKMLIFGLHCSTSISIWSWLLMSTIRFLSVYYPLFHYKLWKLPLLVLTVVSLISVLTNLPMLFMATFDTEVSWNLSFYAFCPLYGLNSDVCYSKLPKNLVDRCAKTEIIPLLGKSMHSASIIQFFSRIEQDIVVCRNCVELYRSYPDYLVYG